MVACRRLPSPWLERDLVTNDVDISRPSAARVYDYFLGGAHNFESDRVLAERVLALAPWVRLVTYSNRRFLRRAVQYLVNEAGIRQFLDVGSGIPTAGNVHTTAHEVDPESRVIYVDVDPVAVAHGRELLAGDGRVLVVEADLRDVGAVFEGAAGFLDFTEPVAVLMVSVLLFIPDAQRPDEIVSRYLAPVAEGSYLAISHVTDEHAVGELREQAQAVMAAYAVAGTPVVARSREQITSWFAGVELVEPGVVFLDDWRPAGEERPPADVAALSYGGVARKPTTPMGPAA